MHLFWLLRIITDEICFVFNICSVKGGGLQGDLDAFNCRLVSVTQLRHESWACEGTFVCNLSLTQKGPCSCGWIQVQAQFLHLLSFTDFSAWADTAAGFKPLWMSKSRQNHPLSTLFCLWIRAHSHVWACSVGQGISLVSKPYHTSGEISQRERKNYQTDWTGTYWSSGGELRLGVHNPHSITLSVLN